LQEKSLRAQNTDQLEEKASLRDFASSPTHKIDDGTTIFSPGYLAGHYYHNWIDAYWFIEGEENRVAAMEIVFLELEYTLDRSQPNGPCLYDYVNFYGGPRVHDSTLVTSLCGDFPPEMIYSPSHQLLIHFHTDSSYTEVGFEMIAHIINPDGENCCANEYAAENKTTECTTEMTELAVDDSGSLHLYSPGYYSPGYYWPHAECNWKIVGFAGMNMKIEFVFFSVESSPTCSKDNVTMKFPLIEDEEEEVTLCGRDEPATFIAYSNEVEVSFNSDCCGEGAGFLIVFTSTDQMSDYPPIATDPCPGPIYMTVSSDPANPTVVESPMTGDYYSPDIYHYGNGRHCQWILSTSHERYIHYTVTDLMIEDSPGCRGDVLQMFPGLLSIQESGTLNVCGAMNESTPEAYEGVVEGYALNLRFVTDYAYDQGHWKMSFYSVLDETAATSADEETAEEPSADDTEDPADKLAEEEDIEKMAAEEKVGDADVEDLRSVARSNIQTLKKELDKLVAAERALKKQERLEEKNTGS